METLVGLAAELQDFLEEYNARAIVVQKRILQDCADRKKGLEFIEDNMPPTDYRLSPSETAPHWQPSLASVAKWIQQRFNSKEINLPIVKEAPLKKEVYVLDKNGMLDVQLYISDNGINCKYGDYRLLDTITPFIGKGTRQQILRRLNPFYTFAQVKSPRKRVLQK